MLSLSCNAGYLALIYKNQHSIHVLYLFPFFYHFRSTSKATYLPRQTHDKQQLSDPDHGSYKLKLASNEDCINYDQYGSNNNNHNNGQHHHNLPNKCNNLPDVLPLAVKYNGQQQQQQQQRYFSPPSSKQKAVPQSAPVISTSNLKSLFNFTKLNTQVAISDELTKVPPSSPAQIISPKYTSQSVFDLQNTNDLLARDDPPPYTDEIKKELVQHLELISQPLNQLIVPPSTGHHSPIIRSPSSIEKLPIETSPITVNDIQERSNPTTPTKRLSSSSEPPSYEETQQQSQQSPTFSVSESNDPSPMKPGSPVSNVTSTESDPTSIKTEIVLRLAAPTSETGCQTDDCNDSRSSPVSTTDVIVKEGQNGDTFEIRSKPTFVTYASRRISPEEVDCDNLSKDLVSQLSPLDKLHSILGEYLCLIVQQSSNMF